MLISLIVGFVLGAAAIVFAVENTEVVALTFLNYQFESSLALLVLIAVAAGILISVLISLPSAIADAFKVMSLKSENRKLAEEVEAHRQAPPTVVVADPSSTVVDLRNT